MSCSENISKSKKFKKGFTLIELLVVVAIISILSAIVVVALGDAKGKARDARRLSDVREISKALTLYADTNGGFPSVSSVTGKCLGVDNGIKCWDEGGIVVYGSTDLKTALQPFLPTIPADPGKTGKGDKYLYSDATSIVYNYKSAINVAGPFVVWVPEKEITVDEPVQDSQCKGMGFVARGGAGGSELPSGRFCAYKIE